MLSSAAVMDDTVTDRACAIDYSKTKNWLHLPHNNEKNVDIFYVYPTAWFKVFPSEPNICAIDNRIMLIGSQGAFDRQASAFETVGNIYAPYYRQGDTNYILSLPEDECWDFVNGTPAKDVTAAFDYYIKNYNNNKPFILVGHSQGSMILMLLLKDYMVKNPAVYDCMISAYVIGYLVTADYMAANGHLKFAEGADDTGVIISYNTQSPDLAAGDNVLVTDTTSLVINPINWQRDETIAPASESLGSYMLDDATFFSKNSKVENLADARIDLSQGVTVDKSRARKCFQFPHLHHIDTLSKLTYNVILTPARNIAESFLFGCSSIKKLANVHFADRWCISERQSYASPPRAFDWRRVANDRAPHRCC